MNMQTFNLHLSWSISVVGNYKSWRNSCLFSNTSSNVDRENGYVKATIDIWWCILSVWRSVFYDITSEATNTKTFQNLYITALKMNVLVTPCHGASQEMPCWFFFLLNRKYDHISYSLWNPTVFKFETTNMQT